MKPKVFAQYLLQEYKTNNPFEICRWLDILVRRAPLLEMRGYFMCVDGQSVITVAADLPELTAHFVCAHELYHQRQHAYLNRIFMDTRTYMRTDRYENEADQFAYHLLFPGEETANQCREVSLGQMANCLNVAPAQVAARIRELENQRV